MAARAYWQGQIRLALVSIPVELYSATSSTAQIAFHQIHEPSGKRIKYEKVVPGVGAVDADDIVKGFEVSKGNYVLLEQDEIDAVKLESKRTLELIQFVDSDEIDVLYFEKPYYVVPADELAEENAPVAVPVSWAELDGIDKASAFTIRDVKKLQARASSKALRGWGQAEQVLPDL